jgi:imidazolonepropionase-like amidohydrolase/esterase/lipase
MFTNLKLGNDINIAGISYGAWLIGQYALHHQNRLNKIVLISPASTIQPITKQFYIRAFLSVLPFRYFTKSFSSWLLEDLEKSKKTDFEKAVDFTCLLLRSYKIARAANPTALDDSELQRISIPTMVLIGENEKIYSAYKAIERLDRVASHISKEMIPGAGHDLASVKADLVNKKVLEFLADKRSDPKHIQGGSVAMKIQNTNDIKETFAIKDAEIFDGLRVLTENSILVEDGKISDIGFDIQVPDGVPIVDGTGCTLIPGLIDSHVHVLNDGALKKSLIFGVATVLDMGTITSFYSEKKEEQTTGKAYDRADIFSAGPLITAPEGHGTQLGAGLAATIGSPEEAQAIVDSHISNGSEYIKIIYDHALGYPTISKETLSALVDAAHKRGKMAVVHAPLLQDARDAVESGADGLVHLYGSSSPDPDMSVFVAEQNVFVITTLTAVQSINSRFTRDTLINDENLSPYLSKEDISILKQSLSQFYPDLEASSDSYRTIEQEILRLKKKGVFILAGTDASDYNFGLMHGVSLHQELELMVAAGLTPMEVLSSATYIPANVFDLKDRGMIEVGRRADLLLVKGDPVLDIKSTRNIVGVWKAGISVDREAYRKNIETSKTSATGKIEHTQALDSESSIISDFEDDTVTSRFGYGWASMTDKMMGGKSSAELKIVQGGANNSLGSLMISGEVFSGARPWAGAVFYPGNGVMAPADLSDKKEIRFWAKGDGKTYKISLTSISTMTSPTNQEFSAGAEWKQYSFPFSSFDGIDGRGLMLISFTSDRPGKFSFQIDYVELR